MRRTAYRFLAAISPARGETGDLARPRRDSRPRLSSRAKLGSCLRPRQPWVRRRLLSAALIIAMTAPTTAATPATAATRAHYGGTLRVMLQSAPNALDIPPNATPTDYWDMARTLSLVGDTLVTLDAQGRPGDRGGPHLPRGRRAGDAPGAGRRGDPGHLPGLWLCGPG